MVVLGFGHLLLHDLEHLLLLEGVILQQQFVVQQQDVTHLLLSEEVYQLRNHTLDRFVLLRFEEQFECDLRLLLLAVQLEGEPGLVVEFHEQPSRVFHLILDLLNLAVNGLQEFNPINKQGKNNDQVDVSLILATKYFFNLFY